MVGAFCEHLIILRAGPKGKDNRWGSIVPRLNVPRQLTIHECEYSYGFLKNHSKERDRKNDLDPHCGGTGGNTDLGGRG